MKQVIILFLCLYIFFSYLWIPIKTNFLGNVSGEVTNNLTDSDPQFENFQGTQAEKFISRIISNVIKTDKGKDMISSLIEPMSPNIRPIGIAHIDQFSTVNEIYSITTNRYGNNILAQCGFMVDIDYQVTNEGKVIEEASGHRTILDRNHLIFSDIIVGMSALDERKATMAQYKGFNSVEIKVKLNKILENTENINDLYFRIFENTYGYAEPCLCGDTFSGTMKVYDTTGSLLLEKKIEYLLGSKSAPMIFNSVLFGKISNSTRTILCKAKYIKDLCGDSKCEAIDENQLLTIEISN